MPVLRVPAPIELWAHLSQRTSLFQGLVFWAVSLLLYTPLVYAGYVTDYWGWYDRVVAGGLAGVITTYDYPANLPVYALSMWMTVHLRAISPYLVLGLTTGLYALAGSGLARLTEYVARREGIAGATFCGWLAGLLWLCSPNNSEVLVWSVCIHYLLTAVVWTYGLYCCARYQHTGARHYLVSLLAMHAIGLLALEFAYLFPVAVAFMSLWCICRYGSALRALRAAPFLLSAGLVLLHLSANKLRFGVWIGHYGSDSVSTQPLLETAANLWRYLLRALAASRYVDWSPLTQHFPDLQSASLLVFLYGTTGIAVWLGLFSSWGKSKKWLTLVLWLGLALCCTATVAQLYFYDLLFVANDRLVTPAVLFTSALTATVVVRLGTLRLPLAVVVLAAYVSALRPNLERWQLSADVTYGLAKSYEGFCDEIAEAPQVYLIGYALNTGGAPTFMDLQPMSVALAGHLQREFTSSCQAQQIQEFIQFNQQHRSDRVQPSWRDGHLIIELKGMGSWFWENPSTTSTMRDSLGFALHTVRQHREVHWRQPPPAGTLFLYQEGLELKRLPYPAPGGPTPSPSLPHHNKDE